MHHSAAPLPHDTHTIFSELLADCPPVDLSVPYHPHTPLQTANAPALPASDDSPSDDYTSDLDSHPTPSLPAKPSSRLQSPEQRRRDHHNTHTRRCRARLNWRFEALNRMLPPSDNAQVKHKVHILDHAITALKAIQAENHHLSLRVALRSNASLLEWVDSFAPQAPTPVDALKPVLDILTFVGSWAYAEIWHAQPNTNAYQMKHFAVKSSPLLEPALSTLGHFGLQASLLHDEPDLVSQVFSSGRAHWSDAVADQCRNPPRRQVLAAARLKSALALPVVIDGQLTHVVAVYDVRDRPRDPKLLKFASFVAAMVGNAFGAAQAQREYESATRATPKATAKTGRTAKTSRKVGQKARREATSVHATPKRPRLRV